ncbi:MAG: DUF2974 domain-containing protein [Oscillospiraceae bacterium]|nr:DUF2974 domain-containing protein [Oscillospiraceae bacterium]
MNLSDEQLCMLEQFCYLDKNVAEAAGIDGFTGINQFRGKTLEEVLDKFDDKALAQLEKMDKKGAIDGALASGPEWARTIKSLKSDKELSKLTIGNEMMTNQKGTALAFNVYDESDPSNVVVAFKGTTGAEEWDDNARGLNISDTPCQKEALDYIESLAAPNITVTGHSKGANKAMYVSITSSKVNRCVAFDGQGFSQEFIDKYWAEIEARGANVINYSLSADFVHILMFPVPNSKQVYCEGYGVDDFKQNHSPNSFYKIDKDGHIISILEKAQETESMTMLHEFTTFLLNNTSAEEKAAVADYLGPLLAAAMAGGDFEDPKGELKRCIASNPDALATILAYLVKYIDVYELSSEDVEKLVDVVMPSFLPNLAGKVAANSPLAQILVWALLYDIRGGASEDDKFGQKISGLLNFFGIEDNVIGLDAWAFEKLLKIAGIDMDVSALFKKVHAKYDAIGTIDPIKGKANAQAKGGKIRDFSQKVYDGLTNTMGRIDQIPYPAVSAWGSYASEEWYSEIGVSQAMRAINQYYNKVSQANRNSKTRADAVFNNVHQIDAAYGKKLKTVTENLQKYKTAIKDLAQTIG